MPAPRIARSCVCTILALLGGGCRSNEDPASYVTGLRVLAIKAEPPEVPAGTSSTLTALAIDTEGTSIDLSWAQCLDPPLQGQAINPDCITNGSAGFLVPEGDGLSIAATMPAITPASLGRPDASGGLYLPHIVHAAAGTEALIASYLLRLNLGAPPNQNPVLSGLFRVDAPDAGAAGGPAAGPTPIDDATPLIVHAGDQITLRATFLPGSAETYAIFDGDPATTAPRSLTETLSVSWFATAGDFAAASSGADVPDTIFHLDQTRSGPSLHLPASGATIDVWVVGRDERGGTDYLHRTLQLQ